MRFFYLALALLLSACQQQQPKSQALALGNLTRCQDYSGLPTDWQRSATAGMQYIPHGHLMLGSALAYADERNFGEKQRTVQGFWIDQTEVTVAQFRSFVEATGYVTDAEKQHAAAIFSPDPKQPNTWWQLKHGHSWQYPEGKDQAAAKEHEAVRLVTKNDAEHYALWLGRELPTEIEWEYAAKTQHYHDQGLKHEPRNAQYQPNANYWQGGFPFEPQVEDHFQGIAPVGCYAPNAFGLYDMIGNVWEWTASPYQGAHDHHMGNYAALRSKHSQNFVLKGGSFLCASQYCARYRASSRHPQEFDLATSHVGFRTVLRGKP